MKEKPADIPEVKITIVFSDLREPGSPIFKTELTEDSNLATEDLVIGVEWATATGLTGYGVGGTHSPNIPAGRRASPNFVVPIPNDEIAHSCNKFIVSLRSIQPGKYKIAPYREGQGFVSFFYTDNDGGNPDNTLSKHCTGTK